MKPLVIFHASCADGFCAAWLLHQVYPDAEFVSAHYGQDPPDMTDRDVIITDFSYKRTVMAKITLAARSLVVLDHHKTAMEELDGFNQITPNVKVVFDKEKSGAMLTYEYLKGLGAPIEDTLWLVEYVQDRDLWTWKLPHSKEVSAALASYDFDFNVWDNISATGEPLDLINEGRAIVRYQEGQIKNQVKHAADGLLSLHVVPVINATHLISEILNELAKGKPFAASYFDRMDGQRQWSLRSDQNGLDVSQIAKEYGGGGHAHAAGFTSTTGFNPIHLLHVHRGTG